MPDELDLRNSDWLTELAGGKLEGSELMDALSSRIASAEEVERMAAEIAVTRRIRVLMLSLREAEVELPEDFEARLMARVCGDQTMLDMLELYVTGFGGAFIELINALLSLLGPPPQTQIQVA